MNTTLPDPHAAARLLQHVLAEGVDPIQERKRFVAYLEDFANNPQYTVTPFKPHHKKALCNALDYPLFLPFWNDYREGKPIKRNLDGLAKWLSTSYGYAPDLGAWAQSAWLDFFGCLPTPAPSRSITSIHKKSASIATPTPRPHTNRYSLMIFFVILVGVAVVSLWKVTQKQAQGSRTMSHSEKTFSDCNTCPTLAVIPTGSVALGSLSKTEPERKTNEHYIPSITIPKPFAIGVHEVTVKDWKMCLASGGCRNRRPQNVNWDDERKPITNVSWKDARSYSEWLSHYTGQHYRLPTEIEWEYAARAGRSNSRFSWGNELIYDRANCKNCFKKMKFTGQPYDVGSFPPNGFGLYDMEGNVWEWTSDCYVDSLETPRYEHTCAARVIRGGSFGNPASAMRLARRARIPPAGDESHTQYDENYASYIGFRIVRDL